MIKHKQIGRLCLLNKEACLLGNGDSPPIQDQLRLAKRQHQLRLSRLGHPWQAKHGPRGWPLQPPPCLALAKKNATADASARDLAKACFFSPAPKKEEKTTHCLRGTRTCRVQRQRLVYLAAGSSAPMKCRLLSGTPQLCLRKKCVLNALFRCEYLLDNFLYLATLCFEVTPCSSVRLLHPMLTGQILT